MAKQQTKILSIGGSIIIPGTGFDIAFLKKFKQLILTEVKNGTSFILVIGGGATARTYQAGLKDLIRADARTLDLIGIETTRLNANFVRLFFGDLAYPEVISDPTKLVKTKKRIIVACGWKPGCSTDTDAVLLARTYGAKELVNVSNIEYVYTKDPNKFSDAEKVEVIDWKTYRSEIVGDTWTPGKNSPFDPIASKSAEKYGMTVSIVRGSDLSEVKKAIQGKKFKGTVIRPYIEL
jgi:uridylate kinase